MFNLKIGGIIAGTAFILSFLLGLISRSSMPMLLLRPLIFAVLFFVISGLVYHLVSRFLPELLDEGGPNGDILPPGSRVNITDEDAPSSVQAFFGAQADDAEEGLGNISDLVRRSAPPPTPGERTPAGMDQTAQDGYNKAGDMGVFFEAPSGQEASPLPGTFQPGGGDSAPAAFTVREEPADEGGFPDSVDILPDLESMAGAFLPSAGNEEEDTTEYSVSAPARKPSSGGKSPEWAGDFNAKEMAAGLRTILNKEKEG